MKLTDRQLLMLIGAGAALLWVARSQVKSAAYAIAPTNPNNVFSEGVDAVGRSISGNEHWTLGGWVYDVLHPSSEAQRALDEQLRAGGYRPWWEWW